MSYVDLNRSGVALMEIVSRARHALAGGGRRLCEKLRSILRYLGTCDGNMEEGSMRATSTSRCASPAKNSARAARSRTSTRSASSCRRSRRGARQIDLIEDGGTIVQETRLFDPAGGETRSMRSKEEAHDYRYFPDPDLLPLELDDNIAAARKQLFGFFVGQTMKAMQGKANPQRGE
jgi:aspartyl-tRNA(Asn)/glutamyl-tRNA(Gln) amidotransferase subunit B